MKQPGAPYSQIEKDLFEFRSEYNDICSNVVDLTVLTNNEQNPMFNYIVAMEGNIQLTSYMTHIGNLIPNYFERAMFNNKGEKLYFDQNSVKAGSVKTVQLGTTKRGAPLRPDCKIGVIKILQVRHQKFRLVLFTYNINFLRIWR